MRLAYVLDEGGAITRAAIPGTHKPLATIGVAEKGYVSVRLLARDGGGHSSMPPRHTAIGRLARAVARLEEHRPAAAFSSVQRELLRRVAAHVDPLQRVVLSNLWITAPLVERLLVAESIGDDRACVSMLDSDWLAKASEQLSAGRQVTLTCPETDRAKLASALNALVTNPVESGYLRAYARLQGIRQTRSVIEADIELVEAVQ